VAKVNRAFVQRFTLSLAYSAKPHPTDPEVSCKCCCQGPPILRYLHWLKTRSHPEMVGDMSRVTWNFDLSKIPFVLF